MNKKINPISNTNIRNTLLSVSIKVPLKVIKEWDLKTKKKVHNWACKYYYRASDSDTKIPPIPSILTKYKYEEKSKLPESQKQKLRQYWENINPQEFVDSILEEPKKEDKELKAWAKECKKRRKPKNSVCSKRSPSDPPITKYDTLCKGCDKTGKDKKIKRRSL